MKTKLASALLLVYTLLPGVAMAGWEDFFKVNRTGGGISTQTLVPTIIPGTMTASATVTVKSIPKAATEYSPHCTEGRWNIGGVIPIAGNTTSECVRVCLTPPAGHEIDASAGLRGTTNHAWSAVFNNEWFADTKVACTHVKDWSAHETATAVLTITVCPTGAGCANTAPPAPPPPPAKQVAAAQKEYTRPLTARELQMRN